MSPLAIFVHVLGGGAAILAGYAALSFRKGGGHHAKAGAVFFASMLVMASTGAGMAAWKGDPVTALAGPIALYFVGTSWRTARLRSGDAGRPELWGLAVAASLAALFLAFGLYASAQPNGRIGAYPAMLCYLWAGLLTLAAALDLNFILRRRLAAPQRIARHLWRMCFALFIATGSFFLGQQKVMPAEWRGWWAWFALALAPLAFMLLWLIRTRIGPRLRGRSGARRGGGFPRPEHA
ncbi:MAG TPA: hypothetical protein VEA61_03200 [Allosphingosinicella sp.]|nr:hypothetical protein [Allosphingosinicella sp.]